MSNRTFFKTIVNQYKYEVEAGINLIKEYRAMAPLILSDFVKDEGTEKQKPSGDCILKLDLSGNYNAYNSKLSINGFVREVRAKYWRALFKNPKFVGKLTNRLRESLFNRIDELREYDFSLHNIYELKIEIQDMVIKGVEDCIVELFDELSHKYCWFDETSNNIHYYNGWKTNKAWIINKKVIIPLEAFRDRYYPYTTKVFEPTQDKTINKLQDIEKCFNYLDGGLTEAVDLEAELRRAEACHESKNIRLKYFTVTFYKKGTCHIVFNNEELLKKFNIFGSQHKGWLPPSYGKKTYEEMDCEEKAVVDEFEGSEEYKKVLANTKYYLFDTGSLNLLESSAG